MINLRRYTVLVPRLDNTGPVNLAIDLAKIMKDRGWLVQILYLGGTPSRNDLSEIGLIKKISFFDFFLTKGVLHTHSLRPDILGVFFKIFSRKCRVVTTVHCYFKLDLSYAYPRWKVALASIAWLGLIRYFDSRVCISDSMRRYYKKNSNLDFRVIKNFCSSSSGVFDQNPVEQSVAEWISIQRARERVILIYVGAINKRKNIVSLARYISSGDNKKFSLLVCGDGPLASDLMKICIQDVSNRSLFIGQVNKPRNYIFLSDALILPSFAEGLPLVVLEAASMGRPSIVSNIAVHRELQRDGIAVTFNHKNFSNLDFAYQKALDMRSDDIRMSWSSRFSATVRGDEYEKMFLEIFGV